MLGVPNSSAIPNAAIPVTVTVSVPIGAVAISISIAAAGVDGGVDCGGDGR
jgi:hypothetical protein